MRRILLNILVALSTLIFVIAIGLWLHSAMYNDWATLSYVKNTDQTTVIAASAEGLIGLGIGGSDISSPGPAELGWHWNHDRSPHDPFGNETFKLLPSEMLGENIRIYLTDNYAFGFGIVHSDRSVAVGLYGLILPWWFVALLAVIAPGLWLYLRVTLPRRRRRHGCCRSCAYDLTGTLKAGASTCPECGHVIATQ